MRILLTNNFCCIQDKKKKKEKEKEKERKKMKRNIEVHNELINDKQILIYALECYRLAETILLFARPYLIN